MARAAHDADLGLLSFAVECQQRKGKVFAGRFHARRAASPRQVRVALRYVLCNGRKHAAQVGRNPPPGWIDRFSTARYFDG